MNEHQPYMNAPQSFRIGEFISKGWEFTKKHLGFLITYLIIMFVISMLFSGIAEALYDQGRGLLSFLMHAAGYIIGLFLQMGFYKSALLITSGIKPGFNQMYANDKHFVSYLGSNILYGLMMLGAFLLSLIPLILLVAFFAADGDLGSYLSSHPLHGLLLFGLFLLLLIPVVYLAVRYFLFPFFVLDKDMGPIEALKASAKATEGHRWFLCLLLLVLTLLNIGGAILLGIGLLFTIPISALALTWVYRKLTNTDSDVSNLTIHPEGE